MYRNGHPLSPALIASVRCQWKSLLERRGLALSDRGAGNFEVEFYRGLVLKASYWRWPDRNLAGNAIDFYTKVLGASFADAMRELTQK